MIQKDTIQTSRRPLLQRYGAPLLLVASITAIFCLIITFPDSRSSSTEQLREPQEIPDSKSVLNEHEHEHEHETKSYPISPTELKCPYKSINDLTDAERNPQAGDRHMITPPADGKVTLVCCDTTAGPWSILVHHTWAPQGAARFLQMVTDEYFNHENNNNNNKVPLFRCVRNFLCQFGLAGAASRAYAKTIPDDANWLPEGKEFRSNAQGVKRFARGYMAYAGGGVNSRNNQLIVALNNNGPLAGGSPWEVPWGELVGEHSFETLSKVYTGYGENGPKQAKLWREDYMDLIQQDFPKLDLINSCYVVEEKEMS